MKSVVITGADGFIGSLLVEKFYSEGYHVYAFVKGKGHINAIEDKSTIIHCDFQTTAMATELLHDMKDSIFYHLAWQGVNGADKGNIDIQLENILYAKKAASFARQIGCVKFLCAGSVAERGMESIDGLKRVPDGMIYASAKQALRCLLDAYCRQIGLNHIWMQFSNVYGPTNKTGNIAGYTLARILNGKEAEFGPAEQPYDLIYINDLIEGNSSAFRLT